MATCAVGRGSPASTRIIRRRDSIGDSAAGSTSSSSRLRFRIPRRQGWDSAHELRSVIRIRRLCNVASAITTASTRVWLTQASATVRATDVARSPRLCTTSPSSSDRRSAMPARPDTPASGGTVASMGLHGSTSSPCNQAAVSPEKAAPAGSRPCAARSCRIASSARTNRAWDSTSAGTSLLTGPLEVTSAGRKCKRAGA